MSGVTNVGVQTEMKSWVNFSSFKTFGPGTPISLIAQLTNTDILDVLGHIGSGARKTCTQAR